MRFGFACLFACLAAFSGTQTALAVECPGNPDALGTSRVIYVEPSAHARIGTMQYRETLPLRDKEVVLTFDDGPISRFTPSALDILKSQCVHANYFLVGRMARAYPDLVRRIQAEGHTIGTHSQNHPLSMNRMPLAQAEREINDGIASVNAALGSEAQAAPFFRIPGLLRADGVESYLASRALMTWSADFPADDWKRIGPAEIVKRALSRLEAKGKGVLLLHDIHPATVLALPVLLKELKTRGYKIVQVMPASPEHPVTPTIAADWFMRAPKQETAGPTWPEIYDLPGTPVTADAAVLPAPSLSTVDANASPDSLMRPRAAARWPRHTPKTSIIDLLSREELPAPNPESFGYSDMIGRGASILERRAARPTSPHSQIESGDLTASIRPSIGHGPVTTASIPRAAFP